MLMYTPSVVALETASAQAARKSPDTAASESYIKYPLAGKGYFYQHDDHPDANSAVPKALQWLSWSAALHAPIEPDEPINPNEGGS